MASLSEFVYWRGFGYVKLTDLSGPYAFDGISTFTLIGSGGGGGSPGLATSPWSLFILHQLQAS